MDPFYHFLWPFPIFCQYLTIFGQAFFCIPGLIWTLCLNILDHFEPFVGHLGVICGAFGPFSVICLVKFRVIWAIFGICLAIFHHFWSGNLVLLLLSSLEHFQKHFRPFWGVYDHFWVMLGCSCVWVVWPHSI